MVSDGPQQPEGGGDQEFDVLLSYSVSEVMRLCEEIAATQTDKSAVNIASLFVTNHVHIENMTPEDDVRITENVQSLLENGHMRIVKSKRQTPPVGGAEMCTYLSGDDSPMSLAAEAPVPIVSPSTAVCPFNSANVEEVDFESALTDIGVTVERAIEGDVSKIPPVAVTDFVCEHRVSQKHISGCFVSTPASEFVRSDCRDQLTDKFCFVGAIDECGSTPKIIRQVLYCLHMTEKHYMSTKHTAWWTERRDRGKTYDIPEISKSGARCEIYMGNMYHRYSSYDSSIRTLPFMRISAHIHEATTGGAHPLSLHFMFIVVEVPKTCDFVGHIMQACQAQGHGRDKFICQDIQKCWVSVIHHQASFGGATGEESFAGNISMRFSDIFDEHSDKCIWQLCREARCIRSARRYMQMHAVSYISQRSKIPATISRASIKVYMPGIDDVAESRIVGQCFDHMWSDFSDKCYAAHHNTVQRFISSIQAQLRERKADASQNNANGAEEPAPRAEQIVSFDPVVVYNYPTSIDWSNEDVAAGIMNLSVCPEENRVSELEDLVEQNPRAFTFKGAPLGPGSFNLKVELSLVKPFDSSKVFYEEWLRSNDDLHVPTCISLPILMMRHQRAASVGGEFEVSDESISVPRSILTMHDFRGHLLSPINDVQPTYDFRAYKIYLLQMQSIMANSNGTQRMYAFSRYVRGAAGPLAATNALSDTGQFGGGDDRIVVYMKIGESVRTGSIYQTCVAEGFHTTRDLVYKDMNRDDLCLDQDEGTLQNTLFLVAAWLKKCNQDWSLKLSNLDLVYNMWESDIGVGLSYMNKAIGSALNGIGFNNIVRNFNGCLLEPAQGPGGSYKETMTKQPGVGLDFAISVYVDLINPMSYTLPCIIDSPSYPFPEDFRYSSKTGLWYKFSELTRVSDGELISRPTKRGARQYCSEMIPWAGGSQRGDGGTVNQHELLVQLLPRHTSASTNGRRVITMRNERTQQHEAVEQRKVLNFPALATGQNFTNRGNVYEETMRVVCTSMPAGAEDVFSASGSSRSSISGRMGVQSSYTSRKSTKETQECMAMMGVYVKSIVECVVNEQCRGYLGKLPQGVETALQALARNAVSNHKCFMMAQTRSETEWNRKVECVQARIPTLGLTMHAIRALSRPETRAKPFMDLVHETAMNWICNPCPVESLPRFVARLINNSFDWGLFFLLGIFADYFDVPVMEPDDMEAMFSDENYRPRSLPPSSLAWLRSFGFQGDSNVSARGGDVLYAKGSDTPVHRSATYLTTCYDTDADLSESPLTFTTGVAAERAYGQSPATVGESGEEKVAKEVAALIFKKYETNFKTGCNIVSSEYVKTILQQFMNRDLHYHNFGPILGGAGFQSVNGILERMGCTGVVDAGSAGVGADPTYIDGSNPCVYAELHAQGVPYAIPPWTCVNVGGNVWRFGVEFRWLLFVRAVFGGTKNIGQNLVQRLFDHLTRQWFIHRVPQSIFPYNNIVTTIIDTRTRTHSVCGLERVSKSVTTLVRPLPFSAVRQMDKSAIDGLTSSGDMPEDVNIIAQYLNLATQMSNDSCVADIFDVHMEMLDIPPIPKGTWVPLHCVSKAMGSDTAPFSARDAPYAPSALLTTYTEKGDTSTVLLVQAALVKSVDHPELDESVAHCFAAEDESSLRILCAVSSSVRRQNTPLTLAVAPSLNNFIQYLAHFTRKGVVLEVPIASGLTDYFTLVEWKCMRETATNYYNPDTMRYMAAIGAAPTDNQYSPCVWPSKQYLESPQGIVLYEDIEVLSETYENTRNNCDMRNSIDTNISLIGRTSPYVVGLSARQAMKFHVKVGSSVYLDPFHPSIPDELRARIVISNKRECDYGKLYSGLHVDSFMKQHLDAMVYPVVTCMLIYDIPHGELANTSNVQNDLGVYVGARTLNKDGFVTDVVYLCVPPRALLTKVRLTFMTRAIVEAHITDKY